MKTLYELLLLLLLGVLCVAAEWLFHGFILTVGRFCIWLDRWLTHRRIRRRCVIGKQSAREVFRDRNNWGSE